MRGRGAGREHAGDGILRPDAQVMEATETGEGGRDEGGRSREDGDVRE